MGKNEDSNLPNFIVVGAAKSGTTALWYYLSQHPEIFVTTPKETNFFVSDFLSKSNQIKTIDEYKKLFNNTDWATAKGEVSPAYLVHYKKAARRILEMIPNCKIIILLRNPVDRVYSRYLGHWIRDKNSQKSFKEMYPQLVDAEIISPALKYYLKIFGEQNVKIFISEKMNENFIEFAPPLWSFLNVSHFTDLDLKQINKSGKTKSKLVHKVLSSYNLLPGPLKKILRLAPSSIRTGLYHKIRNRNLKAKPTMKSETRKKLEEYFKDEIEELERISGRDLKEIWITR